MKVVSRSGPGRPPPPIAPFNDWNKERTHTGPSCLCFQRCEFHYPRVSSWMSIRITTVLQTCRERIRWAKGLGVPSPPIEQIVRVSYHPTSPCSRIWSLSWLAECTLLPIGLHRAVLRVLCTSLHASPHSYRLPHSACIGIVTTCYLGSRPNFTRTRFSIFYSSRRKLPSWCLAPVPFAAHILCYSPGMDSHAN